MNFGWVGRYFCDCGRIFGWIHWFQNYFWWVSGWILVGWRDIFSIVGEFLVESADFRIIFLSLYIYYYMIINSTENSPFFRKFSSYSTSLEACLVGFCTSIQSYYYNKSVIKIVFKKIVFKKRKRGINLKQKNQMASSAFLLGDG